MRFLRIDGGHYESSQGAGSGQNTFKCRTEQEIRRHTGAQRRRRFLDQAAASLSFASKNGRSFESGQCSYFLATGALLGITAASEYFQKLNLAAR